jgi:proteasome accessory factor C
MCGLPGYGPGDLIDLSFAGDTVTVTEDAGMRRPLRLTTAEATALLMALRTLADVPGVVDTAAVRRATVKVERAVGDAGTTPPSPERSGEEEATTATVQQALAAGRALRIRYYTASRDAVSQRTVDPMRLLIVSGRGYLEAWCRRAEAVRLFRLDRVEHVIVLDEPAAPPPEAEPTDLSAGLFQPAPEHRRAVLVLMPDAHWVAEYYPVDEIEQDLDAPDGAIRVVMRYADPVWLVRLVLGLGGAARVVDPPELAAAVLQRARQALSTSAAVHDG